jgi:hypothetical protein
MATNGNPSATERLFMQLEEIRMGVSGIMAATDRWDGAQAGTLTGHRAEIWEHIRKADAELSSVAGSLEALFRQELAADQANPPSVDERVRRLLEGT